MEDNQYLSEEKYQKNKKGLMIAAVVVAAVGLLVGGGLVIGGIIKNSSVAQIDDSAPTYSTSTDLGTRIRQDDMWFNSAQKKGEGMVVGMAMIGFGVCIIFASLTASGMIVLIAKRREIMAFQVQQVAPVAKEGVEKATPVVSKAAGSIAKEISKGIKEGKEESSNKKAGEEKSETE